MSNDNKHSTTCTCGDLVYCEPCKSKEEHAEKKEIPRTHATLTFSLSSSKAEMEMDFTISEWMANGWKVDQRIYTNILWVFMVKKEDN